MKQNLHIVMQAKGGVGKSFISTLLLEFLTDKSKGQAIGIDTDPNNHTLSDIESLDVTFLNIMPDGQEVDIKKFDDLTMFLLEDEKTKGKDIVIDIGATTFTPYFQYVNETGIFEILGSTYNVFVHIPIAGGQSQDDCLNGMDQMIAAFGDSCSYNAWANQHFGELRDDQGNSFEEIEQYTKHKEKIFGLVYMRKRGVLFSNAIEKMKKAKKIFADVNMDPSFNLLDKSRLHRVKTEYWDILDVIIPTIVQPKNRQRRQYNEKK